MRFFHSVTSAEEAKKLYRKLAFENHPDRGGDEETMKQINIEYEQVSKGQFSETSETTAAYKVIIDELIKYDGIEIEIIGKWVWVSGETYPIKNILGKDGLGFKYAKKKKAWYWYEGEYTSLHKKEFSMDEIRNMHEVQTVKSTGKSHKKGLVGA